MNASPRTIVSPRLSGVVPGLVAERVVFEITEHTPVEDPGALQEAVDGLRARGMRFAIEGAGAGFPSLGNILRIAPDFIKLDISLVRGVEHHEANRATASAVARFASDIGAQVRGGLGGPPSRAFCTAAIRTTVGRAVRPQGAGQRAGPRSLGRSSARSILEVAGSEVD